MDENIIYGEKREEGKRKKGGRRVDGTKCLASLGSIASHGRLIEC